MRRVPRCHVVVDGRVDDALIGDLERALDLAVDEIAYRSDAGRRQSLLRQMSA